MDKEAIQFQRRSRTTDWKAHNDEGEGELSPLAGVLPGAIKQRLSLAEYMLASRWGLNASHLQYKHSSQGGNSFNLEMCMCFGSSPRQSQILASGINLKLKSKACYAGLSFHSTGNAAVDLKMRAQLSAVVEVGGWKHWGNSSGGHWTFSTTVPCQVYFAVCDRGLELMLII